MGLNANRGNAFGQGHIWFIAVDLFIMVGPFVGGIRHDTARGIWRRRRDSKRRQRIRLRVDDIYERLGVKMYHY
jgi:hypothetical protein